MHGSFPVFDAVVQQAIRTIAPQRALDVGTGLGKMARLLQAQAPDCQRIGIERETALVQPHGLQALYHHLWLGDFTDWLDQAPTEVFDLVIIGHCLEHNLHSAGQDLLQALLYRSAFVLVVAAESQQPAVVEHLAQAPHRSVWTERSLHWHDLYAWDNCRATTLMLLRGLLPAPLSLAQVVAGIHASEVGIHHFDGHTPVRPARLRLVAQRREVDYRPL